MPQSNSSNIPSRTILKLKAAPRKSPREVNAPPPLAQSKSAQKPGAVWSDEFKRQMQADMDALLSR
jgi:hypothetical protein